MVFTGRKFIVVDLDFEKPAQRESLISLITSNGGEIVPWDERTDGNVSPQLVIVAPSMNYERAEEMKNFMIPTVTSDWVHACIAGKKLVPMRPYSPDPRNYMRDVIACFSQLSKGDTDVLKAGIWSAGGDCTDMVTRYTTHVVATSLDTEECKLVLETSKVQPEIGIRLVRPDWVDVCMSLNMKVDDTPFLLCSTGSANNNLITKTDSSQNLLGAYLQNDSPRVAVQQSMRDSLGSNILEGRKFIFGEDLDLSERVAKTVRYLVETNGGLITLDLSDAQVYIGKWREGQQYIEASKAKLIVGNITWLYWMMIHQKFEKPTHLLHYPEVKNGLPSMHDFKICITNYTGDSRNYLQQLICSLGATYSGKLIEKDTTHLLAAYEAGQKYEAAKKWGIPVVNHLWLEDCYAYWHPQDPTSRLYTYFPPKLSMSTLVGSRRLVPTVLNKFQNPLQLESGREHHSKRQAKQKAGTWLHDAMIVEKEFHKNLKRGKIDLPDDSVTKKSSPDTLLDPNNIPMHKRSKSSSPKPDSYNHKSSSQDARPPSEYIEISENKDDTKHDTKTSHTNSDFKPLKGKKNQVESKPKVVSPSDPPLITKTKPLRIIFSGIDEPPTNKACSSLGLSVVKSAPIDIVIAPAFRKSAGFLQALADAKEFVRPSWIEACIETKSLLPTEEYRLKDEQLSKALECRAKLNGKGLFEGISFFLDHELKDKAAIFRELVKSHRGKTVTKKSKNIAEIGEHNDQIAWAVFIETIHTMDHTLITKHLQLVYDNQENRTN